MPKSRDSITASEVAVSVLRGRFSYSAETGVIINLNTGLPCGTEAKGYLTTCIHLDGRYCHIRLHRLAWALYHGEWPTGEIDHINRDRADNRIENLRIATRTEQSRNIRRALPYGVWYQPQASSIRPFEARAYVDGKYVYLGRSETSKGASSLVRAFFAQRGAA